MSDENVRTKTTPDGGTAVVRRRRSSHHRHRHHRRHGNYEASMRRRQDLRFLAFMLPLGLLAIGFLLWTSTVPRPGRSAVPDKDMLDLSYRMMVAGGVLLALDLIVEWIRKGIAAIRHRGDDDVSFSDGDGD